MSASSAAPGRRAPLLSLWSRDDVRTAVIDFLPTRTIAALPFVAKSLHEVQSRLLLTAIKRRGKTSVPNPPTTRACLDALLVGEPKHFCEDWERGLKEWYRLGDPAKQQAYSLDLLSTPFLDTFLGGATPQYGAATPHRSTGAIAASRLVLSGPTSLLASGDGNHIGFARPLRGPSLRRLRNMLVTRFRAEVSCSLCPVGGEVGCVILCGPNSPADPSDLDEDADALSDLMCALSFTRRTQGRHNLLFINTFGSERVIVAGATPNTKYTVDVIFRYHNESVTSGQCAVDVSVNGRGVIQEVPLEVRPLSSIQLYNVTAGTSRIGNIDIWYERARPDQSWNE